MQTLDTWFLNDRLRVFTKKSIAESIGESMAYFWSSFIGIGIHHHHHHREDGSRP